jgi:restriction system protein
LSVDDTIAFNSLRIAEDYCQFNPPEGLAKPAPPPEIQNYLSELKEPTGLSLLVPGSQSRYLRQLEEAESKYEEAKKKYEIRETERKAKLDSIYQEYDQSRTSHLLKARQRNQEVQELEAAYHCGDPNAVITYNSMVLERSEYPDGFSQEFRLAYVSESKEFVVDYELPSVEVVPTVSEYKYNKSRDTIDEKPRKVTEIKELYQDTVAAVALRTVHEVLEADQTGHVQVVVFNGFVSTVDPATGRDIHPCLISFRATRERFAQINLERIDKKACLRNLGAQVSQSPTEMIPVKPIVEFDMVDKRFVEQGEILSGLDSRPNLMDLKPFEFETLVANLFQQMGMESKLTRSSRDGGVDVVGFDQRPVLGGKVVIQAKRYSNTVGVSAVRDLYGTMMNEGANKGILVTTSDYGPDAFDFAKDKPIELIDGGGLLYLLEQVGIKARIVIPSDSILSSCLLSGQVLHVGKCDCLQRIHRAA